MPNMPGMSSYVRSKDLPVPINAAPPAKVENAAFQSAGAQLKLQGKPTLIKTNQGRIYENQEKSARGQGIPAPLPHSNPLPPMHRQERDPYDTDIESIGNNTSTFDGHNRVRFASDTQLTRGEVEGSEDESGSEETDEEEEEEEEADPSGPEHADDGMFARVGTLMQDQGLKTKLKQEHLADVANSYPSTTSDRPISAGSNRSLGSIPVKHDVAAKSTGKLSKVNKTVSIAPAHQGAIHAAHKPQSQQPLSIPVDESRNRRPQSAPQMVPHFGRDQFDPDQYDSNASNGNGLSAAKSTRNFTYAEDVPDEVNYGQAQHGNYSAYRGHEDHQLPNPVTRNPRVQPRMLPRLEDNAGFYSSSPEQAAFPLPSPPKRQTKRAREFQEEKPQSTDEAVGPDLDHDPSILYKMEFATLRNEPFDHKPHAVTSAPVEGIQARDLAQQLSDVSKSAKQEHAEFFASLDIDDWEDAGAWFMQQFTGFMTQLTKVRREKRKLALQFEDRVESRYAQVSAKRQQTEDALAEMKTSGGRVLQRTPKKGMWA